MFCDLNLVSPAKDKWNMEVFMSFRDINVWHVFFMRDP